MDSWISTEIHLIFEKISFICFVHRGGFYYLAVLHRVWVLEKSLKTRQRRKVRRVRMMTRLASEEG